MDRHLATRCWLLAKNLKPMTGSQRQWLEASSQKHKPFNLERWTFEPFSWKIPDNPYKH